MRIKHVVFRRPGVCVTEIYYIILRRAFGWKIITDELHTHDDNTGTRTHGGSCRLFIHFYRTTAKVL